MKLYTEEQVKQIIYRASLNRHLTFEDVLDGITPIELPNDEEIEEESSKWRAPSQAFRGGAKWVIEQILNQNE